MTELKGGQYWVFGYKKCLLRVLSGLGFFLNEYSFDVFSEF